MSTTSSTNSASSAHFFTPISKSSSVPDIHKNAELDGTDTSETNRSKTNTTSDLNNSSGVHNQKRQKLDSKDSNNVIITNSDSTESAIASPAGSLEQFEVSGFNNSALPLTPDDHADSMNG
jgi:hypothetical protein